MTRITSPSRPSHRPSLLPTTADQLLNTTWSAPPPVAWVRVLSVNLPSGGITPPGRIGVMIQRSERNARGNRIWRPAQLHACVSVADFLAYMKKTNRTLHHRSRMATPGKGVHHG